MKLSFARTGPPADVVTLEESSPREPQGHEVRVRVHYAPINPADLNFIEGVYGKIPTLPATPGNEASGIVEAVGEEVTSLQVGDVVMPLHPLGTWTQHLIAAENQFARLPEGFDLIQAAMLRVNPTTAWLLLHNFRKLAPGDWIAQNAANSGVGRAVIQLAKSLGIHTMNFVRRPELIAELTTLGGDAVFLDTDAGFETGRGQLKDMAVRQAFNAVGGDSALRLMDLLAPGGTHVTYGAMSRRSLKVPNKFLIFKDLHLSGFWVSKWMEHASNLDIQEVLKPLVERVQGGTLYQPVEKVYPFTEYWEAITHAQEDKRGGKILLKFI